MIKISENIKPYILLVIKGFVVIFIAAAVVFWSQCGDGQLS